jgi:hypothetical protein
LGGAGVEGVEGVAGGAGGAGVEGVEGGAGGEPFLEISQNQINVSSQSRLRIKGPSWP